jgi:environmental stress-induced protein Ves
MNGVNNLKIAVINEGSAVVSQWAGGKSSQYFIYPENSNYASRNFKFRISKAVSFSDEEAKYTMLENYIRHLIMLEGTARVYHKGHYDLTMEPYRDIDVFDGGWESSAEGSVTDFNLMVSKDCFGRMSVIENDCVVQNDFCVQCRRPYFCTAFYCANGDAVFKLDSETIRAEAGDLVVFEDIPDDFNVHVSLSGSKLVRMDLCL